jgi:hypothetical protein
MFFGCGHDGDMRKEEIILGMGFIIVGKVVKKEKRY